MALYRAFRPVLSSSRMCEQVFAVPAGRSTLSVPTNASAYAPFGCFTTTATDWTARASTARASSHLDRLPAYAHSPTAASHFPSSPQPFRPHCPSGANCYSGNSMRKRHPHAFSTFTYHDSQSGLDVVVSTGIFIRDVSCTGADAGPSMQAWQRAAHLLARAGVHSVALSEHLAAFQFGDPLRHHAEDCAATARFDASVTALDAALARTRAAVADGKKPIAVLGGVLDVAPLEVQIGVAKLADAGCSEFVLRVPEAADVDDSADRVQAVVDEVFNTDVTGPPLFSRMSLAAAPAGGAPLCARALAFGVRRFESDASGRTRPRLSELLGALEEVLEGERYADIREHGIGDRGAVRKAEALLDRWAPQGR